MKINSLKANNDHNDSITKSLQKPFALYLESKWTQYETEYEHFKTVFYEAFIFLLNLCILQKYSRWL